MMSFKKSLGLVLLLLFLLVFNAFADDSTEVVEVDKNTTHISIESADSAYALDDVFVLSGNVVISFEISNSSKKTLTANKVVVELDEKKIEASGNVSLEDSEQGARSFSGQSVIFDWSNLDVVVFSGVSYTERKNAKGTTVSLYASGETVSYDGDENIIFFNNGQVATVDEDPYWSINASKISFAGSDVFVDNAVIKLGRVPIFYLPIFFYPGTTLSFNPAIGVASDKGAFINTTTELYGVYSGIGATSSSSSSSSTTDTDPEISDYSASLLSLLDDGDSSEKIRDGVYYRKVSDGEDLGALETWARKTSSYFVLFADAYVDLGLSLGYDTSNSLLDGKLKITSTGLFAYNPSESTEYAKKSRYYFDLGLQFKFKNGSASVSMPILSDYSVKKDFLNRNTVFGLDSIFGSSQDFPTKYSTLKSYTWSASGNYNLKLGSLTFNLSSVKAEINFDLESKSEAGKYTYTPKVSSASLPNLTFSSNASWSYTFKAKQAEVAAETETETQTEAQTETEEETATETETKIELALKPYNVEKESTTKTSTKTSTDGSLKLGYTLNESLENKYKAELKPSTFYSNTSGTLYAEGKTVDSWFSFSETLKPQYSFSAENLSSTDNQTKINNLSITSNLVLKVPFLGLTYKLSNKIYSLNTKEVGSTLTETKGWGKWEKTDVTEHSLQFSKSLSYFTFGLLGTFKPVTQSIKPSVSFKYSGFSASLDLTFSEKNEKLQKDTGNFSLSYSNSYLTFSLKNTYAFANLTDNDIWKPYSLTQSASVKLLSGKLVLSENSSFKGKFEPSALDFSVTHSAETSWLKSKGSFALAFKGKEGKLKTDILKLSLDNDMQPIYFWKNRIGLELSVDFSFIYNFTNPYNTSFSVNLQLAFEIAEFLSLKISVRSGNKSFYRYFEDEKFNFNSMLTDLIKSFDFFGDGRKSTGFNLSSYSIELVHYMRDWDACISAEGKLSARKDGKMVWSPVYKFYVKWNAIPELKVEETIDKSKEE